MDLKLQTFLMLCRTMNYHAAAEALHLTQPAVTRQIQSLENAFGAKLFSYNGRRLQKTEKGLVLERYAESFQYNYEEMLRQMSQKTTRTLKIGATKTVGDYLIGPTVAKYLQKPGHSLNLVVQNTEQLLAGLDRNELDFAVIEGRFKKNKYGFMKLWEIPFVGICAKGHPFEGKTVSADMLACERIIIREAGSGTRDILERSLEDLGYDLSLFSSAACISSFSLICQLVKNQTGISFVYRAVADSCPDIGVFWVDGVASSHPIHAAYLKNTAAEHHAAEFFGRVNDALSLSFG